MLSKRWLRLFGHHRRRYRGRQLHLDDGSAFRRIVGHDVTAVLLHDAVADAESEARALAHAFGRVEGIENAFGIFNPGAVIGKSRADGAAFAADADFQFS